MNPFSADELAAMQDAQEAGMMDTCVILRRVDGATDAYGMPTPQWVEGSVSECGYDGRRQWEAGIPSGTGATQVTLTDGRLRLPLDTQLCNLDRIRVTHRFGVMLATPVEYEISGDARRGPSGLLVDLRKVIGDG